MSLCKPQGWLRLHVPSTLSNFDLSLAAARCTVACSALAQLSTQLNSVSVSACLQVVAALRTASMPARSYVHGTGPQRSFHHQHTLTAGPSVLQQQQQQQGVQNLQLAAMEGGYGGAAAAAVQPPQFSSSNSMPGSPLGSPRGLTAAVGRSSSFTGKLFGKQGSTNGRRQQQGGAGGSNGYAWPGSPSGAAAGGMASGGKGGGTAAGDVVLQVGPPVRSL